MDEFETYTSQPEPEEAPILIPLDLLSPEALSGIVREFVLREGTDYGAVEITLETKIEQVLKQLRANEAELYFDSSTESVTLRRRKSDV